MMNTLAELPQLWLTRSTLEVGAAYTLADQAQNGAVVIMSGMVRNQTGGRAVDYLDYQAYEPMALQIFEKIRDRCCENYPEITSVVIHHRLGKLHIGEISVLIAVGAPHRGVAFAACEYAIDALKADAPIWKKEYWQDGDSSWVVQKAIKRIVKSNFT